MNRVVVTGMGVVTPVGLNVADFWRSLMDGVCGVGPITYFDASGLKARFAAELKGFDPTAFGIDKSAARKMDRSRSMRWRRRRKPWNRAGSRRGEHRAEELGVYIGSGIGGMQTFVEETKRCLERGPERVSPHFIPKMIANMATGHVAIAHGAQGPSLSVMTACATSTHAVGEAFHAIKAGYAEAIIAGGAEAALCPLAVGGFISCMALSTAAEPELASIPFDRRRTGFVMGEGAGVLVLESERHARSGAPKSWGDLRLRQHLRRLSRHRAQPRSDGGGARHPPGACRSGVEGTRKRVHQRPRHRHPAQRRQRNARHQKGAWGRKRRTARWFPPPRADRAHAGRGRRGGMRGGAPGLRSGEIPPTSAYGARPGMRPGLRALVRREARCDLALSISLGFGGHNGCVALRRVEA